MAEQLYTIPINEAFDVKEGCPLCRLRHQLEEQSLSYIMGAAMMEPDVRIVTNQLGFCRRHFHRMLGMGNRLSLALMLESHLDSVAQLIPEESGQKLLCLPPCQGGRGENRLQCDLRLEKGSRIPGKAPCAALFLSGTHRNAAGGWAKRAQ